MEAFKYFKGSNIKNFRKQNVPYKIDNYTFSFDVNKNDAVYNVFPRAIYGRDILSVVYGRQIDVAAAALERAIISYEEEDARWK